LFCFHIHNSEIMTTHDGQKQRCTCVNKFHYQGLVAPRVHPVSSVPSDPGWAVDVTGPGPLRGLFVPHSSSLPHGSCCLGR
jgi:hypothetical protein